VKRLAVSGTVSAGVFFPQPPVFADKKPMTQETHAHVMVPADPGTDFVMVHPEVVLGDLEAFFDPVLVGCDLGQDSPRRTRIGVGKVILILGLLTKTARHHRQFIRAHFVAKMGTHSRGGDFQVQGALFSLSNPKARPSLRRQGLRPSVEAEIGGLGLRSATTGAWRTGCFQVPNNRVRRHFQDVAFSPTMKAAAEFGRTAELVITDRPTVRDSRSNSLVEF